MGITIRKITSDEYLATCNLSALSFDWSNDVTHDTDKEEYFKSATCVPKSKYDQHWQERWAAFDGDQMVSCIASLPFDTYFDGHMVGMSGIGGVCTVATHRRQGLIRRQFDAALRESYDRGQVFSFLYPFSQAYYEKFGYKMFEPKNIWKLHLKYIPKYEYAGKFTLYDGNPDTSSLKQAYEGFVVGYNMMCIREECEWAVMPESCNPYKTNRQAYIYHDKSGKSTGCFIFEKKEVNGQNIMWVRRLVFADINALAAILSFAARFSDDYSYIEFDAPTSLNLECFCTDLILSGSGSKPQANGMVRVVNVKRALELASYKNSGTAHIAHIKINDAQLEENSGTWELCFENAKAKSVKPSVKAADIEMSIGDFSAAICGRYSVSQLKDMPSVTIQNPDLLDKVFYRKPMFITSEF